MSRKQRMIVDEMLRRPQPTKPQTVDEMRSNFAAMMAAMKVPAGVRTTQTTLGNRPGVIVDPAHDARTGIILYFHGGSYIMGSPYTAMSLTSNLVNRTSIRSVSLDYRLAPEHPFPAALEDALAAYRELLDNGVEAANIAFAGDSAGGGIAISTCLMARDAGLPMPAAAVMFSPGLDKTHSGASMDSKMGLDPFFTRESFTYTDAMYLAGQDPNHALVSPARFADLTGFPPLLLQVGTNELLLDDSTLLADRARAAGVDVILDVTADVPHVFQAFAGILDEADQALDRAALFITQHLR
ncbi:alpha/beta hydrolase [Paenibacillus glycinis]|uniref:Alpha/beta hydrolase fold domain-containing protein n=1 Tax=Paenibacillus glycinis TaxID=2697035 RepID=A0ABW9XKC6_9BACL|nr:alpha/beta hydrolase [Paenibacillus glycinis]NBD23062.1 alpha/beta hydrolase fold domain-containing protein [Paenibacillus glycinis]